jgi:DivIVA domain-containing protein
MGQYVLLLVVALTVGAVVFGVTVLVSGGDPGLEVAEPDGRAIPLPATRPLAEADIATVRFDTAIRGYRMAQVDRALQRAAYDIGYKDELISVLEAEVAALREGRTGDAEVLRQAREAAQVSVPEDADERDLDGVGRAAEPAPVVAATAEPAVPETVAGAALADAPVAGTTDDATDDATDADARVPDAGAPDAAVAGVAGTEVPAEDEPVDASRAEPAAPVVAAGAPDREPVDAPGDAPGGVPVDVPGNGAVPVDTPAAARPAVGEAVAGDAVRRPDGADEPDQPTDRADGATGQPHPATADRR